MEKCPKCYRKFEQLDDYPLIKLISFKIVNIPNGFDSPFQDPKCYFGWENKDVPDENKIPNKVDNLFKKNNSKSVIYNDEKWIKSKNVNKEIYYQKLENDEDLFVLRKLDNYFSLLEKKVGTEFKPQEIYPKNFSKDRRIYFISSTDYVLSLSRIKKYKGHIYNVDIDIKSHMGSPQLGYERMYIKYATAAKLLVEGKLKK